MVLSNNSKSHTMHGSFAENGVIMPNQSDRQVMNPTPQNPSNNMYHYKNGMNNNSMPGGINRIQNPNHTSTSVNYGGQSQNNSNIMSPMTPVGGFVMNSHYRSDKIIHFQAQNSNNSHSNKNYPVNDK